VNAQNVIGNGNFGVLFGAITRYFVWRWHGMETPVASYRENLLRRIGSFLVFIGATTGIAIWIVLLYFNPYSRDGNSTPFMPSFIQLCLPAVGGLISSILRKGWLSFAIFIITLRISFYLAGTPGIFKYFGFVSASYLVSAILFTVADRMNKQAV
jgi:hypothetical protein